MEAKKSIWPKIIPQLSVAQQDAREDWMKYWHEILPNKYGIVEDFNHGYPVAHKNKKPNLKTLEIGAGLGEHLSWEDLTDQDYHMLEYRQAWVDILKVKYPKNHSFAADIQEKTPIEDAFYDRILAIHVLEHLPDLPKALAEIYRLLKPGGQFQVVIPCEGGMAYEFARTISSARLFKKKFRMAYKPIIQAEHLNTASEILEEIKKSGFQTKSSNYFPLKVPLIQMNICIGLDLTKN
jgi:ubiquinone/menaquinone biosynthesis C-methylase UbiE